jgi:hypothetical protein
MKPKRNSIACLLAVLLTSTGAAHAAPANDNFALAATYFAPGVSADTTTATAEPLEPYHGFYAASHTVWWSFVPELTGQYQIDTNTSTFDTVMSIYTGTKVTALTKLAYDDDSGAGSNSLSQVYLTKGVRYMIAVDGLNGGNVGMVSLHITLANYCTTRTYQALLPSFEQAGGGMVTLTSAPTGAVTGKFLLGGKSYPFKAAIDSTGNLHASASRAGLLPVGLAGNIAGISTISLASGMMGFIRSGPMTGFIGIGPNVAAFTAYPNAPGDKNLALYNASFTAYSASNPCPRAGYYTMYFDTSNDLVGHGIATMTVATTGICTGTGKAGDGTVFSFSGPLLETSAPLGTGGLVIVNVPMYVGRGRFSADFEFNAAVSPTSLLGTLNWVRVGKPSNTIFSNYYDCVGSLYTPPGSNTRVHPAFDPAGTAMLQSTANGVNFNLGMMLSSQNVFSYNAPNSQMVSLTVAPKTGLLTGKLKQLGDTTYSTVNAVVIRRQAMAAGYPIYGFTSGASGFGSVIIHP